MNEQLQPLKKQPRAGKAGRSGTQDDIVYAHIFEAILEQRLAPGTKLSEEALGEIFGVSRTIIRRALSRLAHESVVLLRPNRGAVVASPTVEEARQVFFSRRLVELMGGEMAVSSVEGAGATFSFTVTLGGGKYQLYCPGASTENQTFTVTGTDTVLNSFSLYLNGANSNPAAWLG